MDEVLDMFSFLGESLDVLNEETTTERVEINPLDSVFNAFGQLGDSLDILNVDASLKLDVHPIDKTVEEFENLKEQLNIFKESMVENVELMTEHVTEPIDAISSYDAFHSLAETVTDEIEMLTENFETSSNDAFVSLTDGVNENLKLIAGEIELSPEYESIDAFHSVTEAVTENVKEGSIDTEEEYTSPIVQVMRLFADLWESLAGGSKEDESSDDLQSSISVSHKDVYLLVFLVFTIFFMLVLSFLLCSYFKRKMWEREQWREVESDTDSDCSGSWISIDSSTQVSPIMTTPTKDKLEEVYWFRHDLDIRPSIVV